MQATFLAYLVRYGSIIFLFLIFYTAVTQLVFTLSPRISLFTPPSPPAKDINFWVTRYLTWHDANRNTAPRRIIKIPSRGGFGDNVIGMTSVWVLAVLSRRLFLINATTPYPLAEVLSHRARRRFLYSPRDDNGLFAETMRRGYRSNDSVLSTEIKHGEFSAVRGDIRTVFTRITIHAPPSISFRHLAGDRKLPRVSAQVRRAMVRAMFEPSRELLRQHAHVARQLKLRDREYVAVHARIGAGTLETYNERFRPILMRQRTVANCFARKVVELGASQVLLATDTPAFRGTFAAALRRVSPGSRSVSYNSEVVHYERLERQKDGGRKAHFDMHVENLLVANAKHIVSFHSGFSQVAYWRGLAESYTVLTHGECGIPNSTWTGQPID